MRVCGGGGNRMEFSLEVSVGGGANIIRIHDRVVKKSESGVRVCYEQFGVSFLAFEIWC